MLSIPTFVLSSSATSQAGTPTWRMKLRVTACLARPSHYASDSRGQTWGRRSSNPDFLLVGCSSRCHTVQCNGATQVPDPLGLGLGPGATMRWQDDRSTRTTTLLPRHGTSKQAPGRPRTRSGRDTDPVADLPSRIFSQPCKLASNEPRLPPPEGPSPATARF
jgi:hypothetical protein